MGDMGDTFRELKAEKKAARDRVMTFAEASAFVMPFGKHFGRTIDTVAMTDEGLRYLDWLRGDMSSRNEVRQALAAYLDDPTIAKDVAKLAGKGAQS